MLTDMRVYADQAATTALGEAAWKAMEPWLRTEFGNPSALYEEGRRARDCVEAAREKTAYLLGAEPREIYFTSGGTEADNWAVYAAARRGAQAGKRHLITSAFEHHAVLNPMKALEKEGFELTVLPVHENGVVRADELAQAIRPDTALVSIMFVNNEVGTVQPVAELGKVCRERGVLFHTDAVQAAGHLPIDLRSLPVDLLSLSAHKFHRQVRESWRTLYKKWRFSGKFYKGRRSGKGKTGRNGEYGGNRRACSSAGGQPCWTH